MSTFGSAIRVFGAMLARAAWPALPIALLAAQGCHAAEGGVSDSRPDVLVDASRTTGTISTDAVGTNLAIWYQITAGNLPAEMASLGPRILRWPGGSTADAYHWRTHTECGMLKRDRNLSRVAYHPRSTFDNFMHDVVIPGHYDVAITVNYGSNEACTGGGDPREAAAWVAYAKREGYNKYIKYWTVGNEEYGGWELDQHAQPHDPVTYAREVSGPTGYYALMKAADPQAQVGIIAAGQPSAFHGWDGAVLGHAPYDFVEMHDYAQQPAKESDSYLLEQAPQDLANRIETLRGELAAAGKADPPLMIGEFNSVAYSPGKQSMSIVNALYTGLAYGVVLNEGVAVATWWFGAGGSQLCHTNYSSSLYGWQQFGGYDLVAANASSSWNGCNRGPVVKEGTLFPSGVTFSMVSRFAQPGARMLPVTLNSSLGDVRAYADALKRGYAIMLFNLNSSTSRTITVGIKDSTLTSYSATTLTYDKRLYDQSRQNIWLRPVSAKLGTVGAAPAITLPPWSMTLLTLQ